jgi:hypothetical protein
MLIGYWREIKTRPIFIELQTGGRGKIMCSVCIKGDVLIEGTKNLLQHETKYYKDLFGPAPSNMFRLDPNLWKPEEKLNVEDNENLCRHFTIDEVEKALFSMKKNKAPGPDNIPIEFYQHCWELVQHDILKLFVAF